MASVYGKAALKRDYTLDSKEPDWNTPTIMEEMAKITFQPIKRLPDIHDTKLELRKPSFDFEFKIAPNPFYEGSECYVYYGSDLIDFRRIVLKLIKEHSTLDYYMKKMENRVLCTAYAHAFSSEQHKPEKTCSVDFVQLDIIDASSGIYMLEPYLKGKIPKDGEYSGLLGAFSHYSWMKSQNTLLICGLQGFKKKKEDKIVLTDPIIHSNGDGEQYGAMDGGRKGIQAFFESHTCSNICLNMKLPAYTA